MSETFYVCRECGKEHADAIAWLRAYSPLVTQEGNTTYWDCPTCGKNILMSIDEGTIDLGLVTDEQLRNQ